MCAVPKVFPTLKGPKVTGPTEVIVDALAISTPPTSIVKAVRSLAFVSEFAIGASLATSWRLGDLIAVIL
jgi:hypothetical protein